jgi:restriction system protein
MPPGAVHTNILWTLPCCTAMQLTGWRAMHCGKSGDQGCDVLADRAGVRVALQCKRVNHNVGNKAVQEVYAAKAHTRSTHAAVVTNSQYTKPAVALAASTGVQLLNWRDLKRANQLFGSRP